MFIELNFSIIFIYLYSTTAMSALKNFLNIVY